MFHVKHRLSLGVAVMAVTETRSSADLVPDLLEAADKVRELRSLPLEKRGDDWEKDARNAAASLKALDAEYETRSKLEARQVEQYAWDLEASKPPETRSGAGPLAAFQELQMENRGIADLFCDRDEYRDWASNPSPSNRNFPEMTIEGRSIADWETRTTLTTGTTTPAAGLLMPVAQPVAPTPRQMRMFVRDLIAVTRTGLHSIPYVRELNPATTETTASTVAEGVAKPEVEMDFVGDTAVVTVIAAWIPATMQILADAPTMQGYIYARLAYMIQLREQAEILLGNGVSPDLKGIFTYSGVQTAGTTNDDPFTDLATAIGKVENVDLEADGIVMNPVDYWTALAQRHSTRYDGETFGGGGNAPFGGPTGTIWGLPVVRSRAVTTLTAYVGAWKMGAILFDRMETTIKTSDSHDVFFTANKVAILAEERVALAVTRPDAFVNVTIDITP